MKQTFSDEDLIRIFLDSFHIVSQKTFWRQLRAATRIDKFWQAEFKIDKQEKVEFKAHPLSDDQEAHAATFFRKYISGGDPVYLADVLAAGKRLGLAGEEIDEAVVIFEQLVDKKWRFRVKDGKAVGMLLVDGTPVTWDPEKNPFLRDCEEVGLSFQDFTEVTFNEEMFHAFVPRRNEKVRAVVRSVSEPFRKYLSNVGLAGTLYAAMLLHAEFGKRRAWFCEESCQEKQILDEFAYKRSKRGLSTEKDPTDSFGLRRG